MSDLFMTPNEVALADVEDGTQLIIPASFQDALSYAQQIIWLYLHKQDKLVSGENITLTENPDGTVTISATGGGAEARGIESITGTVGPTGTTVIVTLTDETTQMFFVERGPEGPQGQQGIPGEDGVGIRSINGQTGTMGTTVTVTLTDGREETFFVEHGPAGPQGPAGPSGAAGATGPQGPAGPAGATGPQGPAGPAGQDGTDGTDGADGVGITDITFKEIDANGNYIYTVNLSDGTDYDITCPKGPNGVGISSIALKQVEKWYFSTAIRNYNGTANTYTQEGLVRHEFIINVVYTITYSDNSTVDIDVPPGSTLFIARYNKNRLVNNEVVKIQLGIANTPWDDSVIYDRDITFINLPNPIDGTDGTDGVDGVSPEVTITSITGGHTVTITDADHPSGQSFNVMDGVDGTDGTNGTDGTDGTDGVSPEVTITSITGGHTVTITDADHPSGQSFNVMDGQDGATGATGATGPQGPAGPGVPPGGVDGQLLVKDGSTNYVTRWENPSSGSTIEELTFGLSADNPDVTMFFGTNSLLYGNMISAVTTPRVTFKLQKISDGSHTSFALQPMVDYGTLAQTYFTKGNFNLTAGTEINYSGFKSDYITTQKVVDFFDEFFPAVGEVVDVYLPSLKCQIYFTGNNYSRNYMDCVAYFSVQLSWSNNVKQVRFNTTLRTNLPYDTSQFIEAGFFILP